MLSPSDVRHRYGSVYVLVMPDGLVIPWRPLSLRDVLHYREALSVNFIAPSVLENEIWKKCVVDPVLIDNMHQLKAGTVTTAVTAFLDNSLPKTLDVLNDAMDRDRTTNSALWDRIVNFVCRVYPSYTPDALLALSFEDVIRRLVMAERQALEIGLIAEPLSFFDEKSEKSKQPNKKHNIRRLRQEHEESQVQERAAPRGRRGPESIEEEIVDSQSYGNDGKPVVITANQMAAAMNTDTATDREVSQMLAESQEIFKDYLDKIKSGEKLEVVNAKERKRRRDEEKDASAKKAPSPKANRKEQLLKRKSSGKQ